VGLSIIGCSSAPSPSGDGQRQSNAIPFGLITLKSGGLRLAAFPFFGTQNPPPLYCLCGTVNSNRKDGFY
jgi:hypothetical protein